MPETRGNARKHLLDLAFAPDQSPGVLDRLGTLELNQAGARHRIDRLPGRVRDQMQAVILVYPSFHKTIPPNRAVRGQQPVLDIPRSNCYAHAIHRA